MQSIRADVNQCGVKDVCEVIGSRLDTLGVSTRRSLARNRWVVDDRNASFSVDSVWFTGTGFDHR